MAAALLSSSSCVLSEPTTPLGYVVAPSSPPSDAGPVPFEGDGGSARYSSAAAESDARR